MKFWDEANGFIKGAIYYILNGLSFKLYNIFQWNFQGSRPMTGNECL